MDGKKSKEKDEMKKMKEKVGQGRGEKVEESEIKGKRRSERMN